MAYGSIHVLLSWVLKFTTHPTRPKSFFHYAVHLCLSMKLQFFFLLFELVRIIKYIDKISDSCGLAKKTKGK